MATDKEQFDRALGGNQALPYQLLSNHFANSRLQEIMALSEAIDNPQRTGLAFQLLPKHMRRRIMAHDTKRLPRKVREAHRRQFEKSGLPPTSKRPSRKHRRRPKNLLMEYNRRQQEFAWLETHIWHAKRFHMIKKWGYTLPKHVNDKSFRALYRASSKHCLLQDISYLCCIELTGPFKTLIEGLRLHLSDKCGMTFRENCHKDGSKEGNVTLFRHKMFPYGAIGDVSYHWKPETKIYRGKETEDQKKQTVWIWIHPAFYQETLDEFLETFNLKSVPSTDVVTITESSYVKVKPAEEDGDSLPVSKKARLDKKVEQKKIEIRNIPFTRTPKYASNAGVEMVLLKDTLSRFRLTGPLSQSVLFEGLQIASASQNADPSQGKRVKTKSSIRNKPVLNAKANIDEIFAQILEKNDSSSSEDEVVFFGRAPEEGNPGDWWSDFYKADFVGRSLLRTQNEFWQSLGGVKTPSQLPPNFILGLTIQDPRLCMPARRTKAVPDPKATDPIPSPPSEMYVSPIWDPKVRNICTQTKRSVALLNADKAGSLVPGFMDEAQSCQTQSEGVNDLSRIPVLLIQQPGNEQASMNKLGFGAGWDLVCPVGWGMPVWMALVFRGGRPGGLRETDSLRTESSRTPVLDPDSMAGRREADARRDELTDVYFRYPPKVRANYIKLGIASPFFCAWETLIRDWSSDSATAAPECSVSAPSSFFVLRERDSLLLLGAAVRGEQCKRSRVTQIDRLGNCLVPIALTMLLKGNPVDFSIICMPTEDDLEKLAKDPGYSGPEEAHHDDVHHDERKNMREEHQKLMLRLRKRRVRKYRKEREEKAKGVGVKDTSEEGEKKGQTNEVDQAGGKTTTNDVGERKRKPNEPVEKEIAEDFESKTRQLWLPSVDSVKCAADRLTVGYVSQGNFVFTEACGAGVGYVAGKGLAALIAATKQGHPVYVVVRNPTSYHYRFAKINVIGSK